MTDRLGPPGKEAGGRLYTTPRTGYLSTRPRICARADSGKHLTVVVCPDCAAEAQDRHVAHEATCPLGLAIDARDRRETRYERGWSPALVSDA